MTEDFFSRNCFFFCHILKKAVAHVRLRKILQGLINARSSTNNVNSTLPQSNQPSVLISFEMPHNRQDITIETFASSTRKSAIPRRRYKLNERQRKYELSNQY